MGISTKLKDMIIDYIKPGTSVIELGNQHFWVNGVEGYACKPYFEKLGINHTSIDLNGKDGAIELDLSQLLYLEPADIVTNFGTSEHVENQEQCFENILNFCKVGGLIIHEIPEVGSWEGHGVHYTHDQLKKIYKDHEIIELKNIEYEGEGNLIFCVVRKLK